MLLSWAGQPEVVSALLRAKMNPHWVDTNGDFPLLLACAAGSEPCVLVLLEQGANARRESLDIAVNRAYGAGYDKCAYAIIDHYQARCEQEQQHREEETERLEKVRLLEVELAEALTGEGLDARAHLAKLDAAIRCAERNSNPLMLAAYTF